MPGAPARGQWTLRAGVAAGALAALLSAGSPAVQASQIPPSAFWRDGRVASGDDLDTRSPERDGRVFAQPVWVLTAGKDSEARQVSVPGMRTMLPKWA